MSTIQQNQQLADRLALPMFALSLVFLLLLAALVVVFVDIPRVMELQALNNAETSSVIPTADSHQSAELMQSSAKIGQLLVYAMMLIWPLFWLEYLVTWRSQRLTGVTYGTGVIRALACLIPPLRLATPSAVWNGQIWLPFLQWQTPGKKLSRHLERQFGKPMLFIALLILPILLIEFGLHSLVDRTFWLRMALHVCTGFIWCAFAFEFIIMINATDRKLAYIKKNWLDLAIILLPLISFLRTFRVLRLAKLAKIQQLTKMSRVYRMKGLMTKLLRALMLFEVVHRLFRITPESKLRKLKVQYEDKADELAELKATIERLERSGDPAQIDEPTSSPTLRPPES